MSLPEPRPNQSYWEVSALEGGHVDLLLGEVITGVAEGQRVVVPVLAFILHHSETRANLVFDLGIRQDVEEYPAIVQERIHNGIFPIHVPQDVVQSLEKGGLVPSQITHVCLSHCHWDHVGDPSVFANATFLTGEGSRDLLESGYPGNPRSVFASDLLPHARVRFLSTEAWSALGPFPQALDFFGDGSLYIIDAPGHLPGHLNLLVRTSPGGGWIYLAGDSMVDRRLLSGEAKMVEGSYRDTALAEEHATRMKILTEKNPRVRVILAHDAEWYEANKGSNAFWPGRIVTVTQNCERRERNNTYCSAMNGLSQVNAECPTYDGRMTDVSGRVHSDLQ